MLQTHTHEETATIVRTDTENKEEVQTVPCTLWLVRLGHAHSEHIGVTSAHNRVRDKSTEVCVCVCVYECIVLTHAGGEGVEGSYGVIVSVQPRPHTRDTTVCKHHTVEECTTNVARSTCNISSMVNWR